MYVKGQSNQLISIACWGACTYMQARDMVFERSSRVPVNMYGGGCRFEKHVKKKWGGGGWGVEMAYIPSVCVENLGETIEKVLLRILNKG